MGAEEGARHLSQEAVSVTQVRADEGLQANTGGENGLEVMYSGNICREDHQRSLDSSYPALRP